MCPSRWCHKLDEDSSMVTLTSPLGMLVLDLSGDAPVSVVQWMARPPSLGYGATLCIELTASMKLCVVPVGYIGMCAIV